MSERVEPVAQSLPPTSRQPKSTQRALSSIVLGFESFVVFFATLAAFGLEVAPAEQVWTIGLGLAFACILTPAVLRGPVGYGFGWLLQIAILSTGFWLWGMWFIGTIFLGLWIWAQVIGSTIDRARRNYAKQMEAAASEAN